VNIISSSPLDRPKVLAHLRSLRESLAHARNALMHYKEDRLDRDRLEPAARRVDDLMLMYANPAANAERGPIWVTEIKNGIQLVSNPKAADALHAARLNTDALIVTMAPPLSASK
jgi:hypothetical protein